MIYGGRRACGKTTELIKLANARHLYIVCKDEFRAHHIAKLARNMELHIPYPITARELPLRAHITEVLVDDAEAVLTQLIGRPIVMMTTSLQFIEPKEGESK